MHKFWLCDVTQQAFTFGGRFAADEPCFCTGVIGQAARNFLAAQIANGNDITPREITLHLGHANGQQAYFSNSGNGLFISAPGVGIVSAYSGSGMVIGSGTSQATAITAGVISSLLSRNYNAANIPQILQNNAIQSTAPANQVGAGMIHFPR